jgi:tRNA G10  N-methylase Trm11
MSDYLNTEEIERLLRSKDLGHLSRRVQQELEELVDGHIQSVMRSAVRNGRHDSRAGKNLTQAESNLSDFAKKRLPDWVRDNLTGSYLVGRSQKVIQTADQRRYHMDNKLNELSGKEWTYFLNSVVNTKYSTSGKESYAHHIRKYHPSPKPPQLAREIIEFFTKKNEIVFDYFMGVGGTLLGASLAGRNAVGVDLNPEYVDRYIQASKHLKLEPQSTLVADSIQLLKNPAKLLPLFSGKQASLILIDPPYSDMMSKQKTGQSTKKQQATSPTPFSESVHDLGNMLLEEFLPVLQRSVQDSLPLLKKRGHIVVFMKDFQPKSGEVNLLHSDVIHRLVEIPDIDYIGLKIWADQTVNLYPYGYPYSFVPNQIHQYILVFKRNR